MEDKSRWQAGAVAMVVASIAAATMMVAVVFAEPPNTRRQIIKAAVEKALAVVSSCAVAMVSAPWATDLINNLMGMLPFKLGIKADPVTAAAVVTAFTMLMISQPATRQKILNWVRGKMLGGVQ
jgi:cadmium resistance protein CadD (predicted permease)